MDFFDVVQDMCQLDVVILCDLILLVVFIFQCDLVQMFCDFISYILKVCVYCVWYKGICDGSLFQNVVRVVSWEGIKNVFKLMCFGDYMGKVCVDYICV